MKKFLLPVLLYASGSICLACCSSHSTDFTEEGPTQQPVLPEDKTDNEGNLPNFDGTITPYNGEKATDAALDVVGTDADFYWEANTFTNTVIITYNGVEATIEKSNNDILCYTSGAHVTVDLLTHSVKDTEIILKGKSGNGSLKIYGEKKFKLTLNDVELTSAVGPAINSQSKKRIFVHIAEGTTNYLTDASAYSDDSYYLNGTTSANEDRKGCFFQ